jgi:hypothetical protein
VFEFFREELAEARYIRTPRDTVGRSSDNIAESFFEHLLVLQQMRFENPAFAKKYAKETLRFMSFTNVRTGATDLHNLASILNNPSKFANNMGSSNLRFDELAFKRYLRNIIEDRYLPGQDRAFFMKTQKNLGINSSLLKQARRLVSDYGLTSGSERSAVSARMINAFRQDGQYRSDMFKPYAGTVKNKKLIPDETKPGMSLAAKTAIGALGGFALGYALTRDKTIKQK